MKIRLSPKPGTCLLHLFFTNCDTPPPNTVFLQNTMYILDIAQGFWYYNYYAAPIKKMEGYSCPRDDDNIHNAHELPRKLTAEWSSSTTLPLSCSTPTLPGCLDFSNSRGRSEMTPLAS